MNVSKHFIMVLVLWLAVVAVGSYFTFFNQPQELERLEKAEQVARMKNAELATLQTKEASLTAMTNDALSKWRARYKIIPRRLTSAEVIGYLNELTQSGFEQFDVTYAGLTEGSDYSQHDFVATGRGYYTRLYDVIWKIENSRYFYRVEDLSLDHIDLIKEDRDTGSKSLEVMVSFSFTIKAYFNSIEGASANDDGGSAMEDVTVPVGRAHNGLPPVPKSLLPSEKPATNPFFPAILSQIPPNTHNLVDVEAAQLVSIVGDEAVFQEGESYRMVRKGEDVYLGQITDVDPVEGRVVAHLNKGGIIDEVELTLQTGERYRQAMGPGRLAPSNK